MADIGHEGSPDGRFQKLGLGGNPALAGGTNLGCAVGMEFCIKETR